MSRSMTKQTKWLCAQPKVRSAWAFAQSDQSSLCAQWVAKGPSFLHADSEDSDQTGQMPRLIWVFAGSTFHFVGLSCCGSNCDPNNLVLYRLTNSRLRSDFLAYPSIQIRDIPMFTCWRQNRSHMAVHVWQAWLYSRQPTPDIWHHDVPNYRITLVFYVCDVGLSNSNWKLL